MNINDIIAHLPNLDNSERSKLQAALFDLQTDLDLKDVIRENLDDIKSGRVSSHQAVMNEINASR